MLRDLAARTVARVSAIALALTLGLSLACGLAGAQQPDEKPEQYPEGPHRDQTFYFCTACHGFKVVAAQGMSRERWDDSLTWMSERHKMPKLEGKDRGEVLDYLSSAFPERQQGRSGWRNPFAGQ